MGETVARIISGVALAGLALAALSFDVLYWIFPLLLILFFAVLGVMEYFKLADRGFDGRPFRNLGICFALLLVLAFYAQFLHGKGILSGDHPAFLQFFVKVFYPGVNIAPLIFVLMYVLTLSINLVTRPLEGSIYSSAVTVFGVLYTALPWAVAFQLFALANGVFYIIFFVLGAIATDTGAYFGGRWFGKHNAGLKVSPKKTYEGYVFGFITAILINVGFVWGWNSIVGPAKAIPMGLFEAGVITFILSGLSIFGDLVESSLKRDAKIKDSASMIPGHGGVLDLADAMFFTLPLGYYYLHYKFALGFVI